MAKQIYYPEMNEQKPADSVAEYEYIYGKYYVNTALELSGRGIKKVDLDLIGNKTNGESTYEMTRKAFEAFKENHNVVHCALLD